MRQPRRKNRVLSVGKRLRDTCYSHKSTKLRNHKAHIEDLAQTHTKPMFTASVSEPPWASLSRFCSCVLLLFSTPLAPIIFPPLLWGSPGSAECLAISYGGPTHCGWCHIWAGRPELFKRASWASQENAFLYGLCFSFWLQDPALSFCLASPEDGQ